MRISKRDIATRLSWLYFPDEDQGAPFSMPQLAGLEDKSSAEEEAARLMAGVVLTNQIAEANAAAVAATQATLNMSGWRPGFDWHVDGPSPVDVRSPQAALDISGWSPEIGWRVDDAAPVHAAAGSDDPAYNGTGDTTAAVAASGTQNINALLIGTRWADGFITYSFPDAAGDYQAGYNSDQDGDGVSAQNEGFSQFSPQQQLAIHYALNQAIYTQPAGAGAHSVEGFTNLAIDFAGAGVGTGTMRFANSSDAGTAYNFYPSNSIYGGDGWFGPNTRTPTAGNYSWHTAMHEAGHGLGLKHGHETSGFGALTADRDSLEFSIMTYRTFIGDNTSGYNYEQWGAPQTFMMYDIAALQYMYGADFTSNAGNTIYSWSPTTGDSFIDGNLAIDPGANRIFSTIWDGNGIDTYDLSNYTTNLRIDLRPGESSTFSTGQLAYLGGGPNGGYARGNVFNALQSNGDARSLIENAYGGSGNDSILGNSASNYLSGGNGSDYIDPGSSAGADTVLGGNGNDIIVRGGGGGDDQYYGGPDNDTISPGAGGTGFVDGVVFDLQAGYLILNGANYEVWNGFENYNNAGGSGQEDVLGTSGANLLQTGSGASVLEGRGGSDTLIGGAGIDTMRGGAGDDFYNVDNSGDRATEFAGEGYDEVYASASYGITDFIETLFLTGAAVEGYGNSGNNAIIGNNAGNLILAGEGDFEFINGLGGADLLIGGAGHDEIMGGAGADTFRFTSGLDAFNGGSNAGDFFYDFTAGEDKIQFNAAVFGIYSINPGVNFHTGPSPGVTHAVPTLLYSTSSAYLLYDPDGSGNVAPYVLAVLNGAPTISATDFSFY